MGKISINLIGGSIEKKDVVVGIDLGTTNSLIAYAKDGTPTLLGKETMVPSVIEFNEDGSANVGQTAKNNIGSINKCTIYSVKRLLGRSYKDLGEEEKNLGYKILDDNNENLVKIEVNGTYYTAIELSAIILKKLKKEAETALGQEVFRAVITVPAYFNDSQRQATRDAGKLAGLEVLRIVSEPTAAALAYGVLDLKTTKNIAVYDLGGGTFDISILTLEGGVFEVLATNGDTHLGGDDIDLGILNHWKIKEYAVNRNIAEDCKKHFSNSTETYASESRKYSLTFEEFKEIANPIIEKTILNCKKAMQYAGLELKDLDEVLLVGGTTRIQLIRDAVSAFFNKEVNTSLNPDEAVALGASIEADILAGNRSDILLLDVTPLSLGIETLGGLMDIIVNRNSKIPTSAAKEYTTSVDGQVNLKIAVYQGERELIKHNRKLAEFTLKGIPSMPAGLPKIQISFILNADGILQVKANELRSNTEQTIEVQPQYGLTDAQVEEMLMASFTNAEADIKAKLLLETINEAGQIIYHTERFIEKHRPILKDTELSNTMELVNKLKEDIKTGSKNTIESTMDALNTYTKPFAEIAMDNAINQALKGKQIE